MDNPDIALSNPVAHVSVVTLNRPPVNALNRRLRESFVQVFDRLEADDDVRAIVLTAIGPIFCAGADIKEKAGQDRGAGDHIRADRLIRDGFFCVLESSKPVIAAVQGPALGAGFVLASCCDVIVAADDAYFAMPEIDVGQGGGASFLQRILPLPKIRRMLLTGERVPAAELYRLGAIEACLPQADVLPQAIAIAEVIAAKSPAAVRRIRGSFAVIEALGVRDGFRVEQTYTGELSHTADASEARRAFLEKRRPVFDA
jgi:enoyl-CoA hydratase